ncbi:uncharacterized protein METZ01_LOCUS82046 [marine metagenome]|uniref:Uncharacterized protein n=1 Tax=marine metagenome TaxID=408172 RepID=A0A381UM12_9ZZZZ
MLKVARIDAPIGNIVRFQCMQVPMVTSLRADIS